MSYNPLWDSPRDPGTFLGLMRDIRQALTDAEENHHKLRTYVTDALIKHRRGMFSITWEVFKGHYEVHLLDFDTPVFVPESGDPPQAYTECLEWINNYITEGEDNDD